MQCPTLRERGSLRLGVWTCLDCAELCGTVPELCRTRLGGDSDARGFSPSRVRAAVRVFLTSLGCKLNQGEIDAVARRLANDGHQVVRRLEEADLHVVNTCTVTHNAARDSRRSARRASREGIQARTVLTGCWATSAPLAAMRIEGVELVVENGEKAALVDKVYEAFPDLRPRLPPADEPRYRPQVRTPLVVEDGCDMGCAFCVIPSTRGRQSSRDPDQVVAEAIALHDAGCVEVVVTGVQISAYRFGDLGLRGLVRRLLDETPVGRFRLTSLAPWQFDPDLLEAWSPRLCRHLHFSLQSGCDATLRRMRRPYDTARFSEIVALAREAIPGIAITTDVITGFPGETDDEFARSLDFVAGLGFARVHVFTYSERPSTRATALPGSVPVEQRRERTGRMLEVAAASERAFRLAQIGRDAEVLWEDRRAGCRRGTTDNYLRVRGVEDAAFPVGSLERVLLRAHGGEDSDVEAVPL
jgi:threonylcarbamoyladenosine tRNA methylthiotransferase MtaB